MRAWRHLQNRSISVPSRLGSLIERIKAKSLDEKDYEALIGIIETVLLLYQAVSQKSHSIQRLLRMIFGAKTESADNVLKDSSDKPSKEDEPAEKSDPAPKEEGAGKTR